MASGPSGREHDFQNQLFSIVEAPRYFKLSKNAKPFLKHDIWVNMRIEISGSANVGYVRSPCF